MEKIPKQFNVADALKHLPKINIAELWPIQGNLKDLAKKEYDKLKRSIRAKGFFVPVFVWPDPATGRKYLLDGHQRQRVILAEYPGYWIDPTTGQYFMLDGKTREPITNETGKPIPAGPSVKPAGKEVPYIVIEAASHQEAKEKLMIIDSKFGKVTKDGYDEFVADIADVSDFIDTFAAYEEWRDYDVPVAEDKPEHEPKAKDTAQLGLHAVVVNCRDAEDQTKLYTRLIKEGFIVRKEN